MSATTTISFCAGDDPGLLRLLDAMTAEVGALYGVPPGTGMSAVAPGARYLLARRDDALLGCCAVQWIEGATWELNRVYVTPEARGTGLSRGLVEHAEDAVRGFGGERMRLETGVRQPAAIRLYERAGYRRIPKFPPYDRDPVALCYAKALDDRAPQAPDASPASEPGHASPA